MTNSRAFFFGALLFGQFASCSKSDVIQVSVPNNIAMAGSDLNGKVQIWNNGRTKSLIGKGTPYDIAFSGGASLRQETL